VFAPLGLIKLELVLGLVRVGGSPALTVLLIPIAISAAFGGFGQGLAATAAASLGADFFLIPPEHSLKITGTPNSLAMFGLIAAGVLVSLLSAMLRRSRFRAEISAQQFRFLARVGAVLASSLDYAATLENIAKLATEGPASSCGIHLLADDGSPYLATYALADQSLNRPADPGRFLTSERPGITHPALRTMQSGRSLFAPVIDDAWLAANTVSEEHERTFRQVGIRSMLIVPVVDLRGRVLGALSLGLMASDKRRHDESDLAFAEELGRRAGAAIENARSYAHEVAYRRVIDTTHDGVLMLDDKQSITFVNSRMLQLLGYADASEVVGHPLVDFLTPAQAAGAPERLARRQRGIAEQNELCFQRRDGSELWTLVAATPFIGANGVMGGSQSLKMITDITERKRVEAELAENAQRFRLLAEERHHAAYHDPLTGLPNRALFLDRLGQALVRMQRHPAVAAAILFVDLDRFKVINDSLGHSAGDQLLAAFASRLTSCHRPYDLVARLGGDEFTILLDDVATERDAALAAQRILRAIEQPFDIAGREVSVTASIGIALGKTGFENAEAMLRDGDTAMYRAKEMGRARYEFFTPEMHSRAMARLDLEIALREALEREELHVAYQPIVALESGRITGFEALARWQRAGEAIPPDLFIPLAEETGLIHALGEWVLNEASRQARVWNGLRPEGPVLAVSVNVSAKQLSNNRLTTQVTDILADGLQVENLQLEITESVLMDRNELTESVLREVHSLGVKIELDDFGTGYSSLGYLQRLPIDWLKIDRSFISGGPGTDISNPEIVQAIVAMAHSLGLGVTAEGVETAEQLRQLLLLRCTNAQGFYLSRPVDEAGARALVTRSNEMALRVAGGSGGF
jgi:diguanylate cyclase (GGDEF)-like protein/PAS domain S-box-containing protein